MNEINREAFEERAAIMEYDGGPSRAEAERLAAFSANDGPALPADDEARIRAWLAAIGETDPDTITEVINGCRLDADVRRYFLWRAALPFERTGGRSKAWSL